MVARQGDYMQKYISTEILSANIFARLLLFVNKKPTAKNYTCTTHSAVIKKEANVSLWKNIEITQERKACLKFKWIDYYLVCFGLLNTNYKINKKLWSYSISS